ncbi:gephyrin-like molybdotransferase Glp [Leucobacter denitrificans]|uniref:Molybdopterin molybdenumtransferase n=1 Tax=Leucobacter denitrificans TaxID=683042 RepID=A0A7G9S431_9MICO|nr:gephyrin-like molybdotransferase Glp [Leucobacter denitrificans]QNN62606.1 molybdopterin molybdotransferase MoeA [Leucobacter denitrificans]
MTIAPGVRTLEQHRDEVTALLTPLIESLSGRFEGVNLADPDALGRVLATAITAHSPVPAFDNSQMDGYAVCAADLLRASNENPVTLPLGLTAAAGDAPVVHASRTASPVMTGAAIPVGADAVVPVEATMSPEFPELVRAVEQTSGRTPAGSATFLEPVTHGAFVRFAAEDIAVGDTVLDAGTRLTPARIGAAAAVGVTRAQVRPRIQVLLCATGDELTHGAQTTLSQGHIYDANTPMLAAALRELGAEVRVVRTGDNPDEFLRALHGVTGEYHLVVTSGGISKGAYEVVRAALAPLGVWFGSVAMQPGGPQGLGEIDSSSGRVPVLCFPGNPVSSLLSLELFLAPTLKGLAGRSTTPDIAHLPLAHDVDSPPAKHQIRRGSVNSDGTVSLSGPGSHLIGDLAAADVLVHLPVGLAHAEAGTTVETWRFND